MLRIKKPNIIKTINLKIQQILCETLALKFKVNMSFIICKQDVSDSSKPSYFISHLYKIYYSYHLLISEVYYSKRKLVYAILFLFL